MSWGVPKATGPYPVGCHDILDQPGLDSSMFRIYYPTKSFQPKDDTSPNWMEPEYRAALAPFMGTFEEFTIPVLRDASLVMPENITKLPLIVLSHGLFLSKDPYSFVCSDLASYGFIVAAVDHRDGSACASLYMEKDGDKLVKKWFPYQQVAMGTDEATALRIVQVERRVEDLKKVMGCMEQLNSGTLSNILTPEFDLSQFKGKVDIEKCSIMGHSHGGAAAIAALATDARFKVCIGMDAWMLVVDNKYYKMKIDKPILFINCLGEVKKFEIVKMRQLDGDVTGVDAERKMVTILGTTHLTQSDFGFFPNSWLEKINFKAKNDPAAMNLINTNLTLGFIRKHFGMPGSKDVDAIVKENSPITIHGTDMKVEDKEIEDAKAELKAMLE